MATANTVEVRKPKVTIPDESTDFIEYQATIPFHERAPTLNYDAHGAGGDRVESPTASELIQKVARAQNAMFESPTQKKVTMEDGSGKSASFSGYETGPLYNIMFSGLRNGKTLVHRCSRLSFINTAIYRPARDTVVAEVIEKSASAANPCAALKLILEEIIAQFSKSRSEPEGTTDFEIRNQIHEDNKKIIDEEWYPILEASTKSGINDFAAAASNKAIQVTMYNSIRSVYLSGAENFNIIISQFETMFQMCFVPGHMGETPGKFIPMTDKLSDPESKEVNIVSLAMSPGPRKFLSPTAVAIRGAPSTEPPVVGQVSKPAGYNMITWPESLPEAGQTVVMQMPSWLPAALYPLKIPKTGTNLNINSNYEAVQTSQKEMADASTIVAKICADIARLTYNDISLAVASASITCPFDVSWEIGKRYSIKQPNTKSAGSSVLFSGFLISVTHRVSSKPAQPEATTQLIFSHVEANGFTLPNK
jgi:hypothetical protein